MMTRLMKIVALPLLCCCALVLSADSAEAQKIRGYGQFLVGKNSGPNGEDSTGRIRGNIKNPSDRPMFVLVFSYWPDGTLDTVFGAGGCLGAVIPPHGYHRLPTGTPNEVCVEVPEEVEACDEVRRSAEVIAVRSGASDPLRGVFDDNHPQIGVVGNFRKHHITKAMRPSDFHLPTGEVKDQLLQCSCSQMDASNVGNDLMEEIGIFCP